VDTIPMYPYYIIKDLFGVILFLAFFALFVFFAPNTLGHPDNYIPANPLVTPSHIVPEWYLLPFYAILRSIPDKLLGVLAMLAAILLLIALPYISQTDMRSGDFRPVLQIAFWFFLLDCLILGWIGSKPVAHPYLIIGQAATFFYFFSLLVLIPFSGVVERWALRP